MVPSCQGMPLPQSTKRKIEQAYTQDTYIRSSPNHTGCYKREAGAETDYLRALEKHIDFSLIRDGSLVYVLQLAPNVHSEFIQRWTSLIGGSCILIKRQDDRPMTLVEHVQQCKAELGIDLDDKGSISLVTSHGKVIHSHLLTALIAAALSQLNVRAVLGVPASHRSYLPSQANRHQHLRYAITKESLRPVMEATVGLPFSPAAYPLYAISLILQHLVSQPITLDQLLAQVPIVYTAQDQVRCQWNEKGIIMRRLLEWIRSSGLEVELLDGIRVTTLDGSVHILPDPDEPLFSIFAEAGSYTQARIIAHEFAARLSEIHASQPI